MAYITSGEKGGRVLIHDGYKYQKKKTEEEKLSIGGAGGTLAGHHSRPMCLMSRQIHKIY